MMSTTTTTTATTSSIPIVDIGPFLDRTDKHGVAKIIGEACETIGFFMIRNHGVPSDLLERVRAEAALFFDSPLAEKSLLRSPFGLGYMGDGIENVANILEEGSEVRDSKESLNLTLPVRDGVWPTGPSSASLRKSCEEYYGSVLKLAHSIMRAFALALGLDETFFDDKVDRPYTTLRLLNYPAPSDFSPGRTRNAAHTDYGTLTILWSPDSRGLQARTRGGEWIDVVSPDDCFVVNIGDLMANWTNDTWVSTLHRVVDAGEKGRRRMSVPFFHNPNPNAVIECVPGRCPEGETPKYPPIVAKRHLERKVSAALGEKQTMVEE